MHLGSTEVLKRLANESGYIVLNAEGKCWLKNSDGSAMQFVDGHGKNYSPEMPRVFLNDYLKEGLIQQDRTAPAKLGLIFRLTKDGIKRGKGEA
jgi:hypothetical protein